MDPHHGASWGTDETLTHHAFVLVLDDSGIQSGLRVAAKADVVINVKGMVCSFCAQGVEKKLTEIESVARVAISIETKTVEVWLKTAGTLTDEQIKKAINSAGYNIEKIVRGSSTSQKQISGKPDKDPTRQAP